MPKSSPKSSWFNFKECNHVFLRVVCARECRHQRSSEQSTECPGAGVMGDYELPDTAAAAYTWVRFLAAEPSNSPSSKIL